MRRISGNQGTSFGVVFAHQPDGKLYTVEISLLGYYQILVWDGSDWDAVSDDGSGSSWLFASEINTDYNVVNTIEVEYTDPIYSISINDTVIDGFNRTAVIPDLSGGTAGYISRIGSDQHESLPEVPVEVEFKMIAPEPHP